MRTPSMTVEAAESELGHRGVLSVNAANRVTVRKWLTAKGVPASWVGKQRYEEMQKAYNDVTNTSLNFMIEAAKANGASDSDDDSDDVEESGEESVKTRTVAQEAEKRGIPTHVNKPVSHDYEPKGAVSDAGKALADLVGPYLADSVLERVMAKVDSVLADVRVTRIELVRQDGSVVVADGHTHPLFAKLLRYMRSRQVDGFHPNIFIVGPTGSGKTHSVKVAAKLLEREFFTNGALTMDHQVVGFRDAAGNYHETPFRQAFARKAVYLFDEIDSSDNSALLCLAGALANGHMAFPDGMAARHPDSIIIAAGNTWGHGATSEFVGRNRIDGAIRSRFPVRIHWDYDEELEIAISGNPSWAKRVQRARRKAREAGLKVTIDPRMSIAGAALIAGGATAEEAAEDTYLADLSPDQRKIVDAA